MGGSTQHPLLRGVQVASQVHQLRTRSGMSGWGALTGFAVTCNVGVVAVRERVSAYRARMRAQGLRPVQIWVPDVRSPDFAAEAHRQSALVAAADGATDDMDFVEAVSDGWDG